MNGSRKLSGGGRALSTYENSSTRRVEFAQEPPLDAVVRTDVPIGRLFKKRRLLGERHVVVGARALLSLPSGMQLSARQEIDGWMLVAWRVPKRKDAGYDYVDAPVPWRKRRFPTTDDLLEAMMHNERIAVRS